MSELFNGKTQNNEISAAVRPTGDSEPSIGVVERRGIDRQFIDYYGLIEQPFGVTPDLRFLYLGAKHRQALDVLEYGTELNRGFLTLIAKPGMGKTSILFQYLEGLRNKARTAFLFQTDCDSTELMRYLLTDLGLNGKGMDLPEMRAALGQVLLAEMEAGRRFVLVIDEAQNLDEKVLESVRLLSNFETPWMKLMQIVLAGQPQLADKLAKPSMAQLRQRVSFAIRIEPFNREEVDLYIDHRLWIAGYKGPALFSVGARTLISERSEGVPRIINNMCFCAMSFAWAMKQKTVDREMMTEVLAGLIPGSATESDTPAPTLRDIPEEPKPTISLAEKPVGLPLKSSPPHRGLAKVATAGLVAIALGWFGLQYRVDKWVGSTVYDISSAVKASGVVGQGEVLRETAPADDTNTSSGSPEKARHSKDKDVAVPEQNTADSSTNRIGRN
jgi:general secretion pathway protein A